MALEGEELAVQVGGASGWGASHSMGLGLRSQVCLGLQQWLPWAAAGAGQHRRRRLEVVRINPM
jgi:hypothetical protein